jgi:excinuclease ABC subunit C
MGRCLGPCVGLVNREDYGRAVQEAVQFLKGRGRSLVAALKADMAQAADNLDFERAARFRDRIQAVSRTLERQDVARPHRKDQDVLGLAVARGRALIFVLLVRQGLVSGGLGYFIPELPAGGQVLEAFLKQYYTEGRPLPDEILLPHDLPDRSLLAEVLSAQKGAAVRLVVGKAGVGGKGGQDRGGEGQGSQNSRRDRQRLLALAQENAWAALTRRQVPAPPEEALADLQIRLSLPDLPQRLECLDISTLQGGQSVGALVVFSEGRPDKSCYRRFRIRGVVCQDDFAMLREVVQRHYGKQGQDRPDLLVVDGGLGQLNVVLQALSDLGMESFPVVALAKAREKEGGEVPDRLFLPGRKNPKFLPASAPGWSLLLRLRDEAHRFAVTYHRQRARRELLTSALRQVPGIGPVRQKKLFQHFGSLEAIRNASLEELTQVPDLTRRAAQALQEWLSKTPTGEKDTADGA